MSRWALLLLAACGTVGTAVLLWTQRENVTDAAFRTVGGVLVADDRLAPADFIFVLNGRISVRAGHAAELYHRGLAPAVLIAETEDARPGRRHRPAATVAELIAAEMVRQGVPASAIEIIPGCVRSTVDEARALRGHLRHRPAGSVIVATTDFHTGRARWLFRRTLRGLPTRIQTAGAHDGTRITPDSWWRTQAGRERYGTEAVKWAGSVVLASIGLLPKSGPCEAGRR